MNTNEMIKALESQGYKVKKPSNREWWIQFFEDGSHQLRDEIPTAPSVGLIELIHVVEKKMRKRRKTKHEKQQTAEVGPA